VCNSKCFVALEALADGGVRQGLPRETAIRFAAQTLVVSCQAKSACCLPTLEDLTLIFLHDRVLEKWFYQQENTLLCSKMMFARQPVVRLRR